MGVKILSQGGRSLADMYDVVGSSAGIESLEAAEVTLVHEMGAVLFSERFNTTVRRFEQTGIAASATVGLGLSNMPAGITRIIGLQVFSDDASRLSNIVVSMHDAASLQETPFWVWSGNSRVGRIVDDGSVGNFDFLLPDPGATFIPTFTGGEGTQGPTMQSRLVLRGTATAFGAGTVDVFVAVVLAFQFAATVSSFGARVPSW